MGSWIIGREVVCGGGVLSWRDCSIDLLVYVDAAWVGGFEIGVEGDG